MIKASKYNAVINGTDFKVIDADTVRIAKMLAGTIPQNGIKYIPDSRTVVLQSNNVHDIIDAARNGGWSHSQAPLRVEAGWEVIVVPNNAQQEAYGPGAVGVQFTATGPTVKDATLAREFTWSSTTKQSDLV